MNVLYETQAREVRTCTTSSKWLRKANSVERPAKASTPTELNLVQQVVVVRRGVACLHRDDLSILETHEGKNSLGIRIVGKVNDGVSDTDFFVLEQDSIVLGGDVSRSCKLHDIGLAHGHSTHVWIEHEIFVNKCIQGFSISFFPGFIVCGNNRHVSFDSHLMYKWNAIFRRE